MRRIKQGERAYISYGEYMSLMQMSAKCPTAARIGKGYLRGWRLMFQGEAGNGVENIVPCYNGIVPVAVWAVSLNDEMELDKRYNYPNVYTKLELTVVINKKALKGYTYVLNVPMPTARISPEFKDIMREGYSDTGVDIRFWPDSFFEK